MNVVSVSTAELGRTSLEPEEKRKISLSAFLFSLTVGVDDILTRPVDPAQMVPGPLGEAHLELAGFAWLCKLLYLWLGLRHDKCKQEMFQFFFCSINICN